MTGRRGPGAPSGQLGLGQVLRHLAAAAGLTWRAGRGTLIGYPPMAVLGGLVPVAAAWLTKVVFDQLAMVGRGGTGTGGWPALLLPAAALAGLGLARAGLLPAQTYLRGRLTRAVGLLAMDRLYRAMGRVLGLARLEDPAFRDRLNLAQQAGRGWPAHLVDDALATVQATVTLVGFVAALATLNGWLAMVVLASAVPALILQLRLSRGRAAMLWRIAPNARREGHYAELLTSLPAAKELRLFGLTGMFRGRMLRELSAANAEQARQDRREFGVNLGLQSLTAAIAGGGLVWAIWTAARGGLGVGDVAVFVAAVPGTQASLQSIIERIATAHQAALMFDHYRYVETAPPDLAVPVRPRPVPPLRAGIELDDVWFRYGPDSPWVLRGVDLTIPAGTAVALVGLNGAGKSTLIKLLCRFYDPTRGAIRWDGTDLRELSIEELRGRIGAVFQDYMGYDLTAAENIAVGDLSALGDSGRIVTAARSAGIHDTLVGLPRGYDTLLSRVFYSRAEQDDPETGVLLSGGQWQRLALARAFLRDKRDLMILDEPSAGLDAEAEYRMYRELRRHRAGSTSVLISHRLGAVRDADLIVTLAGGRITERGTHRQLVAADGGYARLFRLQAAGYQADEPAATGPAPR